MSTRLLAGGASHPGRTTSRAPLLLTNLLNDLATLAPLLVERIAAGDQLDAFLLAAGMHQIAEDHVHRDPFFLRRGAERVRRRLPRPWNRVLSAIVRAAGAMLWQVHALAPGRRAASAWLADVDRLVQRLATVLADASPAGAAGWGPDLQARAEALVASLGRLPASLRRGVLRLPSCFRSFDQAPEDLEALAARFAGRWPDRDRRLLVVGVRSSGGYLAPLLAAELRGRGYRDVEATTLRPRQRWLLHEARRVRRAGRRGGLALLIDDPPRSWGSLSQAARELARLGFDRRRIVLTLATFDSSPQPPPSLGDHPAVLLPFAEWAIRRRLEPDDVREALAELLAGEVEVLAVRPRSALPDGAVRAHAEAVYEVECRAGEGVSRRLVRARGVGCGYLGAHALAVAARLRERVNEVYGIDRGVLYELWPPPDSRLGHPLAGGQAAAVADYVARRGRALALDGDRSHGLLYRGAAWQWAADPMGGLYGRASELGRLLAGPVVRRLLAADTLAVIDNRMEPGAFALAPDGGGLVKCDFDLGVFTSDDFICFDPVSDLALAAVGAADPAAGDRLRSEYESATGRPVDPERWLLYQLDHVLRAQEKLPSEARGGDLRPARLLQRYYREVLLGGLESSGSGPLCAIDLDGVLETTPLGFPATSPAGALALRAMIRHGYRPVLATGRSVDEVRDRCDSYGLAGGVAEYGSALYLRSGDQADDLRQPVARVALRRLHATLAEARGVHLDPGFQHSVRAYRLDARGRRRGLPAGRAAEALAASGTGAWLRVVHGQGQSDFIAADCSKERALRHLARELGAEVEPALALAVGDTASDLGMLRMARLGIAPGNADRTLEEAPGVVVVRPQAQAGLSEAVARLVGHRPGTCPACAPPPLSASSRLLLDWLGVQDLVPWRRLVRGFRILLASRSC